MWHGYFGVENLALPEAARDTLIQELRDLGPDSDPRPAHLCHWRVRLDNEAAIFEALFNEDNITVAAFVQRLATIFGVAPGTIEWFTNLVTFGVLQTAVVTFSRLGTDYLRVAFFGYDGEAWPTWMESGNEARAYITTNSEEWELPVI